MSSSTARNTLGAALAVLVFAALPGAVRAAVDVVPEASGQDARSERERSSARGSVAGAELSIWHGEPVHVTARGTVADWPSALATDTLNFADALAEPADFQDWITRVPGVGATGQNGLFETFSIRGSGGNGILILAAGVPVAAQRRAGVPVSFVEPELLGNVSVTRGPAVVHFGPGALGGAVSLEPRWFSAPYLSAGYASSGDEMTLVAGTGTEAFSMAVASHRAGDARAPDGTPLNTSYSRSSATLQFQHRAGAFAFDGLLMPSRTDGIGKSNSRFPTAQVTDYPRDEHTLGRLRVRHDNGFEASVYGHDQELTTWKRTPRKADAFAYIASTDGGTTVQQSWTRGAFKNNVGVEYFGRRNVTGYDAAGSMAARTYSLRGASEDAWSLFALTDWRIAPTFALELGARGTWINQQQAGADKDDSDAAATVAAVWTPTDRTRWSLNVAGGYRFASLEERFYTGVTGRGEIIGNPNLGSERSLGADLGYAWWSGDWSGEFHVWRTNISGLIQKIELMPDVEGYVNVGRARFHGAEAVLGWTPAAALTLQATGAMLRGTDRATGAPVYGVPPARVSLDAAYDFGAWTLAGRYAHHWRMHRPGFEEVPRKAVDLVDAELRYRVNADLGLKLYVRNLFDRQYYATADELSSFAPERSVGVSVTWSLN